MTFNYDETTTCGNCGITINAGDALYDQRTYLHFCDDNCFADWADSNYEDVFDYYKRMNL